MKNLVFLVILLGVISGCGKEPVTFSELKDAGQKAFVEGNYAEARGYLLEALKKNQSDRDVLYFLGVSYQRDFMYDSAMIYLKRADLLHKNDREINKAIYSIAQELNEYKYGLDALNVLVKTGDSEDRYLGQLADLNYAVGYKIPAYRYYRKMLDKEPDNINLYFTTANVASQIESVHVALDLMNQAIERFGDKEQFQINRAIYLAGLKQFTEAERIMRSYIGKTENPQVLKLNLANVLSKQSSRKKKEEGLRLYKELREEVPSMTILDSTITALEEELR